jgi:hypothetical protein
MDTSIEFSFYEADHFPSEAHRLDVIDIQDDLAAEFKALADEIITKVPEGRCRATALTNLQQAFHWVDAAMDPRRSR